MGINNDAFDNELLEFADKTKREASSDFEDRILQSCFAEEDFTVTRENVFLEMSQLPFVLASCALLMIGYSLETEFANQMLLANYDYYLLMGAVI